MQSYSVGFVPGPSHLQFDCLQYAKMEGEDLGNPTAAWVTYKQSNAFDDIICTSNQKLEV